MFKSVVQISSQKLTVFIAPLVQILNNKIYLLIVISALISDRKYSTEARNRKYEDFDIRDWRQRYLHDGVLPDSAFQAFLKDWREYR